MKERFISDINPVLPLNINMCDCEAHVLSDGILHIVGSVESEDSYCSNKYYHLYTRDMHEWILDRCFFSYDEDDVRLYAPDFVETDDGIVLFFCLSDGREGYVQFESWETAKCAKKTFLAINGIDPAAYYDWEEKQVYLFWGQFNLKAGKVDFEKNIVFDIKESLLDEKNHFFHEGSSIRKIDNRYYILYASILDGKPTKLDYAVSDSILGKYNRIGTVIDNAKCDPHVWNNHGSIERFAEDYYVFYHRSFGNSPYHRHLCIEKIEWNSDGVLGQSRMSSDRNSTIFNGEFKKKEITVSEICGRSYIDYSKDIQNETIRMKPGSSIIFRFNTSTKYKISSFSFQVRGLFIGLCKFNGKVVDNIISLGKKTVFFDEKIKCNEFVETEIELISVFSANCYVNNIFVDSDER